MHWNSIKRKRVTRSVLELELYAMFHGIGMAMAIGTTLNIALSQLGIGNTPIVIGTDSFLHYECMGNLKAQIESDQ